MFANAITSIFQQIFPGAPRERMQSINSYNRNMARVWSNLALPEESSPTRSSGFNPDAFGELSTCLFSLSHRMVLDGVTLIRVLGSCIDIDSPEATRQARVFALEIHTIHTLGFRKRAGAAAVEEYAMRVNEQLEKSKAPYRFEVNAARKWCTVSNVEASPPRYIAFQYGADAKV
jgi:hypothetical protein